MLEALRHELQRSGGVMGQDASRDGLQRPIQTLRRPTGLMVAVVAEKMAPAADRIANDPGSGLTIGSGERPGVNSDSGRIPEQQTGHEVGQLGSGPLP